MVTALSPSLPKFHFIRVRKWRGLWIAAPRIFWMARSGAFEIVSLSVPVQRLPAWPEWVETKRIMARLKKEPPQFIPQAKLSLNASRLPQVRKRRK